MISKTQTLSTIAASIILSSSAFAETTNNENALDPIVVSADFREAKLSQTSKAITVIGEEELYDKASQPLMQVLGSTANVNFSEGGSKAKYLQIRGMGERGQFETPINPTVGFMVDGIDLSNATLGASLFDTKQVEVLRGPQGTTFGANALAGVVSIQSNEPTKETEGRIEATAGNYNTRAFGAAVGGTLVEDKLLGRVSVYKNDSDGFIENKHLNRKDTNGIDELSVKTKLKWLVSDEHTIDMTYMHINNDNGYDAFSQDNSRTTLSDKPGKDTQKTDAFAVQSKYQVSPAFHVETSLSHSTSDIEYSFDEDWTAASYAGVDQYLRDKKQTDFDIRALSDKEGRIFNNTTDWTIGAYYKDFKSDLTRNETYLPAPFVSDYKAKSKAIYGQINHDISDKVALVAGVRLEKWSTDYSDSDKVTFDDTETLKGAKLGLEYKKSDSQFFYTTLTRGYKPGGFNPVTDTSGLPKQYDTEVLWNADMGVNGTYLNGKIKNRTNFFYGERENQQVGTSYQNESFKFTDYITNATKGHYYGLESEVNYIATDALSFDGSLGLLRAKFDTFYNPVDKVSKDGRTPAQSPKYQYNIGVNYMLNDSLMVKSNVEGRGSYYFSNTHDKKSEAYKLVNASVEYLDDEFSVIVWGRNLNDADYQTRGYFFDNGFSGGAALYTQQGMPRTFGVTVSRDF